MHRRKADDGQNDYVTGELKRNTPCKQKNPEKKETHHVNQNFRRKINTSCEPMLQIKRNTSCGTKLKKKHFV